MPAMHSNMNRAVRCTREHMGVKPGDRGVCYFGSDYEPGWDAGRWSVKPDSFPETSPYGHLAVSYWTEDEMLNSWEYVYEPGKPKA